MILVVGLFSIAFAQRPRGLVPGQALADGDILCQIKIFQPAPVCSAGLESVDVELTFRIMCDDGILRAALTDQRC